MIYVSITIIPYISFDGKSNFLAGELKYRTICCDSATTFFLVTTSKKLKNQSQFNWTIKNSDGSYNINKRLGVHLIWSNGNAYVDHGSIGDYRLEYRGNDKLKDSIEKTSTSLINLVNKAQGNIKNAVDKLNEKATGFFEFAVI